jgi:hypothetical protein
MEAEVALGFIGVVLYIFLRKVLNLETGPPSLLVLFRGH